MNLTSNLARDAGVTELPLPLTAISLYDRKSIRYIVLGERMKVVQAILESVYRSKKFVVPCRGYHLFLYQLILLTSLTTAALIS